MYELIDSGDGRRLERFGEYILDRPDPQIIWKKTVPDAWLRADALFDGEWQKKSAIPDEWQMEWETIRFTARLTPFKHTGVFPEQEWQWSFIADQCSKSIPPAGGQISVLSLFGYTGIAALVAAHAGARVTYVDSSKPALTWARKNQQTSGLTDLPIRWILDDVLKFVGREARRGVKYDAIIMDPPVYGHGPDGQVWDFNKSLPVLADECRNILTPTPRFVLINAYAVTTSAVTLGNILGDLMDGKGGAITSGELVLEPSGDSKKISTGIWGLWKCDSC